jgi:phosphohistidine swiveling domain-containing protein
MATDRRLVISLSDRSAQNRDIVGGKAVSLAIMLSQGLPVPFGFCVTTEAFRSSGRDLCNKNLTIATEVGEAYRVLGSGRVAVRSSATWEDGEGASFAGQQQTLLNVQGEEAVLQAISRCIEASTQSPLMAYRRKMAMEERPGEMAIVVQRMVDAEVAGVLFTRDPLQPELPRLRIEASWGLGEAVVAGRVTPDRYVVDRQSKEILERLVGSKKIQIKADHVEDVAPEMQSMLCLNDEQVLQLVHLSEKVEQFFQSPRDIEWAYAEGKFWLLQARPITVGKINAREGIRQQVIEETGRLTANKSTVWSRIRLVENLPHPTPMTWELVSRKLLSGSGGTGLMYRDLGYDPDPSLADRSPYDLIGGRPYLNLLIEPYMQASRPCFSYPLARYHQQPHLALDPTPVASFRQWLRLPKLLAQARRIDSLSKTFADTFLNEILPAWSQEIEVAKQENLSLLDLPSLYQRFNHWAERTLVDFARNSLKPTLLAEFTQQAVQHRLTKAFGSDSAKEILNQLSLGTKIDPASDLAHAWVDLAQGKLSKELFLEQFGHRGRDEMELASPRWEEESTQWENLAKPINRPSKALAMDPDSISEKAKWDRLTRTAFKNQVELFQRYLGLRETSKHALLLGYREIRRTLLELDRRYHLNGGIFFLLPSELPDLLAGRDLKEQITHRKRRHILERKLEIPSVLFASDLEVIGRIPPPPPNARQFHGTTISAGVAIGKALVVAEPTSEVPEEGFILVCPSTDPSWVPFFAAAKGLVMEVGGILSHGAIVAREFGLPAVAGLPDILQQIQTGQTIQVDGNKGIVSLVEDPLR